MPRSGFIAVVALQASDAAVARLGEIRQELAGQTEWSRVADTGHLVVWARGGIPIGPLPGGGMRLGAYRQLGPCTHPRSERPHDVATRLVQCGWGEYVALLPDPGAPRFAIFRDPSGQLDALAWEIAPDLQVVASDYRLVPPWLRPAKPFLNWERIACWLAAPAVRTHEPLFDAIEGVAPGELLTLEPGKPPRRELLWRPGAFAAAPRSGDRAELQTELVRRLDLSVEGALAGRGPAIVRLSGGLDSSIVAGAIGSLGLQPQVACWLNRFSTRREGDERHYAEAVTSRLGVSLTACEKPVQPFTPDDLAELADAFWPAMNGVDTPRDRNEIECLAATGAEVIVSGDGGDALFFHLATPHALTDAVRLDGWRALATPLAMEIAQRTRTSVWSVAIQAWRQRRPDQAVVGGGPGLLQPDLVALGRTLRHPWTEDALAAGLPPAKALQVMALANHHTFHGDSRARRVADLAFPILAQPVVEHLLAIPVPMLVDGGGDRPFAREAFAHRLPDLVRERRRKGAMSAYFGQVVAASADHLRPYLLDGCLAAAGLLDRPALARSLDPAELIRGGRPIDVLWLASAEAWVRYWQTRVPDSERAHR